MDENNDPPPGVMRPQPTSPLPQGPGNPIVIQDQQLPAPRWGRDLVGPGPLAQLLISADFRSLRRGNRVSSNIARDLMVLNPLNDPFLRGSRRMTATALLSWLNQKKANAESGIMTVVGEKFDIDAECVVCQELRGVWARCSVVQGPSGQGLGCNNCHQLGRDSRCDKFVPRAGGAPATATAATRREERRRPPAPHHDQHNTSNQIVDDGPPNDIDTVAMTANLELDEAIDRVHRAVRRLQDAGMEGTLSLNEVREVRRADAALDAAHRNLRGWGPP